MRLAKSCLSVYSNPLQPSQSRGKLILIVSVSNGQSSCMQLHTATVLGDVPIWDNDWLNQIPAVQEKHCQFDIEYYGPQGKFSTFHYIAKCQYLLPLIIFIPLWRFYTILHVCKKCSIFMSMYQFLSKNCLKDIFKPMYVSVSRVRVKCFGDQESEVCGTIGSITSTTHQGQVTPHLMVMFCPIL